jgi:hypothetical protein
MNGPPVKQWTRFIWPALIAVFLLFMLYQCVGIIGGMFVMM